MTFRSSRERPDPDALVAELFQLAKTIGPLSEADSGNAVHLLSLNKYAEADHNKRAALLLADLKMAVDRLPAPHRDHARLLLSFDAPGTNITHRRELAPKPISKRTGEVIQSEPRAVEHLRELYTLALVACELEGMAASSPRLERGPGYVHERIAHSVEVDSEQPWRQVWRDLFDIRVIRDNTYLYLVGTDPRGEGHFKASPYEVARPQQVVGAVPMVLDDEDGLDLAVIYLGRPHAAGESCRIQRWRDRIYDETTRELPVRVDSPPTPIAIELMVTCPRALVPEYRRVIYDGAGPTASVDSVESVTRTSDAPMEFIIRETTPPKSYELRFTLRR